MHCVVTLFFENYRVVVSPVYVVYSDDDISFAIQHFKHTICDNNPTLKLLGVDYLLCPIETDEPYEIHR